jgi:flavin reductase (DIM6/NTAB) family NADH-FMN oxidoreductase RutF
MILKPADLSSRERYHLLTHTVLPRPIAWVSTMDQAGILNVAPFSYFTVVCSHPMTLLFCPGVAARSGAKKDTLRNIGQLPEFVINLVNEETAEAMNLTAASLPPGQSEFDHAGLTPAPSQTIRVPRVAEAPVAYECKLQQIVTVNDQPGGGSAVFGEVQCIHFRDDLLHNGLVQLELLKPIGRLGGSSYIRLTDKFELERPA